MQLDGLNKEQKLGVTTTEGPLLILAGAGSGKTRVLTYRTAYLIEEMGVKPYNIMAITFTNKAAKEMRERIDKLVGNEDGGVWVSTFHSACVRILRRFAERIGYGNNFTIYDSDDSKTLIKHILKDLQIDSKRFKEKMFMGEISSAKNELIGSLEYRNRFSNDYKLNVVGQVYQEYEARLRQNNAFDFDDLIMKTVELFKTVPEVLNLYQDRLHYIMVDEYQDTNNAQFQLIRLLAGRRQNLCVVGDDDQSIYKFRGANIYNILNFEKHFPDAKVIKLEQNYRSTQVILDAANGVIKNNVGRKAKKLWTEKSGGDKITFRQFESAYEEADYIAMDITSKCRDGLYSYMDDAILYRTNAQSRILEEKLMHLNIPYKIIGGVNFYSRMEIKDILSYLHVIENVQDEIAIRRIINVPKRGIGAASLEKVSTFARANGYSFYESLLKAKDIPTLGKAADKIKKFTDLIEELREDTKTNKRIALLIRNVYEMSGYAEALRLENTEESKARLENLEELYAKGVSYDEGTEEPTLTGFLEEVALVAQIDDLEESKDYVVLMTLHSAKGLEFPNVYMAGMEDGLFPGFMSMMAGDDSEDMEEERRLCYVGITRAKERLVMTAAKKRMLRGEIQYSSASRFIKEIPNNLLDNNSPSMYELGFAGRKEDTFSPKKPARSIATSYGSSGSSYQNSYSSTSSSIYGARKPSMASGSYGSGVQKKLPAYIVGDKVKHRKFGEGVVSDILDKGRDYEVTVLFDTAGPKKMFASFAKLEKI
ncbi:MAG: DNA helicase PcrA [Lachnospiraceae bacterium]|nr:DNA helicase PcrA [Lachnospiraceae bacterium]